MINSKMFDPKTQGFFPIFYEKYHELILKSQLECGDSLEDKLKSAWSVLRPEDPFKNIKCLYGDKSAKKSAEIRALGNAYFHEKNYSNSLLQYSIAFFSAPSGSEDMALALANRSAALQKLHRFLESLTDIHYVIQSGSYPKEKVFKLYERQAEIYETLIQNAASENDATDLRSKLKTAIGLAQDHVWHSNLNQEKKKNFIQSIQQKLEVKPNTSKNPQTQCKTSHDDHIINPSLQMQYEPGRGRYMIATRDIPPGETVMLESPGSFALHPDKYPTHCQTCFKVMSSGTVYPCEACTWVSFCSLGCKETGMSFHVYECGINKWFLTSGLNIYPFLVLRSLTQLGPDKLNEIKSSLFEKRDESKESIAQTEEDVFRSIFQLNCHEGFLTMEDWHLRVFIALFMIHCLKVSGYLKADNLNHFNDDDLYIGSIILKLLNVCPSNCHDISEYQTPVKGIFSPVSEKSSLGAAIYPFLAMFNHSCDPSFMRCNIGNKVWCVSNKTIKKGDEVFENYGIIYTTKFKADRQLILKKHYKFDCVCQACEENWPDNISFKQRISSNSSDRFDRIYCRKCLGQLYREDKRSTVICCYNCLEENDVHDLGLRNFSLQAKEVDSLFTNGKWREGLELFKSADELMNKNHLRLPFYDFQEMQVSLWKGMWIERGNFRHVKMI